MINKPVASSPFDLPRVEHVPMKLMFKLILVAVAVIVAVASGQAVLRARRVSEQSLGEMRHDLAALALALGTTADALWRSAGPDAAMQAIERLDASYGPGHEQLRLVRDSAAVPTFSTRAFAALSRDDRAARVEQRAGGLAIALTVADGRGLLEIRRPLHASQAGAASPLRSDALYILSLALLSGVALLIAGSRLVGRPLRLLIDQARALAGDRGSPGDVPQSGELALLAVELERLRERLEQVEAEARRDRRMRTVAFESLRRADRLSTVGKIASSMAHDLGTPLNVVSGRAMMILSTPGCPPEIASDARIIGEQANSMTQIIRQVLEYSRRRDLHRTRVHVRELIDRAIVLVEPLAEDRGISVEHLASDRDLIAHLDEHKVLQILTNLMANGVQAMSAGGRLRMQAAVLTIEDPPDSRAAAGTYLRISVEDNGVGIDKKTIDTLFEPFFTTKGKGQGSGLGLPVCQGIIREHGGWIDVHSQVGHGSRFDVYLPTSNDEGENQ
jgi:two-component system NtrC family sensor kinase